MPTEPNIQTRADIAILLGSVVALINTLADKNPAEDSPEGRLLLGLMDAVEAYETHYFPDLGEEGTPA